MRNDIDILNGTLCTSIIFKKKFRMVIQGGNQ